MIDSLARKYVLPVVLGFSLSMPAYARDDVPEIELEQIVCHDAKTCYKSGLAEFNLGQYERAEALFKRATSLAPPGKTKAILLYNMGCTSLLGNKGEKASEYFKLYLNENIEQVQQEMSEAPSRLEINSMLVGIELYQEGTNFFSKDQFSEAIVMYSRSQKYFEQHPELALSTSIATSLHLPLGRAYDKAGKFADAHREYHLYVDTAPASVETPKVQQRIQELELLLAPKKEEKVAPVVLPPAVPPPIVISPPSESFFQQHRWSLLTASGAVALGAGALINHLSANADYQALQDRCEMDNSCSSADADTIKRKDTITALLSIGSALALGSAGALFYFELPKNVTPSVTSDGIKVEVKY